jgi:uncharacterized cupin superfamily protein
MATIVDPKNLPAVTGSVRYPPPYDRLVAGRHRRALGNAAGLKNFGVNLTVLDPGTQSSARHWHSVQDELVYVIDGEVVLITEDGETVLGAGMAAGFRGGDANGHTLANRSELPATILEIGDRLPGDVSHYPDSAMGPFKVT